MFKKVKLYIKNTYHNLEILGNNEILRLTEWQQITISVFQLINFRSFFIIYEFLRLLPIGAAYIFYFFGLLIIAVPIHSGIMFLAFYSKRKIIRLWNCVPIFNGLGYTILILKNIDMLHNNYVASVLFYFNIFSYTRNNRTYKFIECGNIWHTCDFSPETKNCVSLYGDGYLNCSKDKEYTTSISVFISKLVNQNSFQMKAWPIEGIKTNHLIISVVVWCIMGIFIFLGLKRLMKAYMVILLAASFSIVTILVVFHYGLKIDNELPWKYINSRYLQNIYNFKSMPIWIFKCVVISCVKESSTSAWIGSLGNKRTRVGVMTITIYFFKLLGIFGLIYIINNTVGVFFNKFKNIITHCPISIIGDSILLELAFETMYEFDKKGLWTFVYINSFLAYTFVTNVLCGIIIVDSILDAFPSLKKRRLLVTYLFVMINCIQSMILYTDVENEYSMGFSNISFDIVNLVVYILIALSLNYFYSLDNVHTDFHFIYRESPTYTINQLLEASSTYALLILSCGFFWILFAMSEIYDSELILIGMLIAFLILSPIWLGILIQIIQGVNKTEWRPCQPHHSWGPSNPWDKIRRLCFVPKRDICYRHANVTCTHRCLVKNIIFNGEKGKQRQKLNKARQEMKNRKEIDNN